jgi:hypothetical protein
MQYFEPPLSVLEELFLSYAIKYYNQYQEDPKKFMTDISLDESISSDAVSKFTDRYNQKYMRID